MPGLEGRCEDALGAIECCDERCHALAGADYESVVALGGFGEPADCHCS